MVFHSSAARACTADSSGNSSRTGPRKFGIAARRSANCLAASWSEVVSPEAKMGGLDNITSRINKLEMNNRSGVLSGIRTLAIWVTDGTPVFHQGILRSCCANASEIPSTKCSYLLSRRSIPTATTFRMLTLFTTAIPGSAVSAARLVRDDLFFSV